MATTTAPKLPVWAKFDNVVALYCLQFPGEPALLVAFLVSCAANDLPLHMYDRRQNLITREGQQRIADQVLPHMSDPTF